MELDICEYKKMKSTNGENVKVNQHMKGAVVVHQGIKRLWSTINQTVLA